MTSYSSALVSTFEVTSLGFGGGSIKTSHPRLFSVYIRVKTLASKGILQESHSQMPHTCVLALLTKD